MACVAPCDTWVPFEVNVIEELGVGDSSVKANMYEIAIEATLLLDLVKIFS